MLMRIYFTVREFLKKWWYSIESIFEISCYFDGYNVRLSFILFDLGPDIRFRIPLWLINSQFKDIKTWVIDVSKNKFIENQIYFGGDTMTGFTMGLSMHQDHAGFETDIGIFGLVNSFKFIDSRHWDFEFNRYKTYPDEAEY